LGIDVEVAESIDVKEWDELLANSEEATVFQTYEWMKVLHETYPKYTPLFITARNGGKKLIGGMPLIMSKSRISRSLMSMPFGTYGGAVVRSDIDNEPVLRIKILEKLNEIGRKWKSNKSVIVDFTNKHGHLESLGFKRKSASTHVLKLDSSLEYIFMKKVRKKTRSQIRQAIRKGVAIDEVNDVSEVKILYDMIKHTYRRHGSAPYPAKLYENIFKIMGEKGIFRWYVARDGDIPISCTLCFTYKDSMMYWAGASYEKYWELRPNDLLIWSMIEYGVKNGYKNFNLGASPPEARELKRFKESWGAERVDYSIYEKSSPLLQLALLFRDKIKSTSRLIY